MVASYVRPRELDAQGNFCEQVVDLGRFLNEDQSSPSATLTIRNSGGFTIEATWNYRAISVPQGASTLTSATASPTTSRRRCSCKAHQQTTDRWSTNLWFHWRETAGTGFFVVYNDTEGLNGSVVIDRSS